jgi:hypothetical protein
MTLFKVLCCPTDSLQLSFSCRKSLWSIILQEYYLAWQKHMFQNISRHFNISSLNGLMACYTDLICYRCKNFSLFTGPFLLLLQPYFLNYDTAIRVKVYLYRILMKVYVQSITENFVWKFWKLNRETIVVKCENCLCYNNNCWIVWQEDFSQPSKLI